MPSTSTTSAHTTPKVPKALISMLRDALAVNQKTPRLTAACSRRLVRNCPLSRFARCGRVFSFSPDPNSGFAGTSGCFGVNGCRGTGGVARRSAHGERQTLTYSAMLPSPAFLNSGDLTQRCASKKAPGTRPGEEPPWLGSQPRSTPTSYCSQRHTCRVRLGRNASSAVFWRPRRSAPHPDALANDKGPRRAPCLAKRDIRRL